MLSPAKAEVSFGEYFGSVNKMLYSDEIRSSFEITLSSAVAVGTAGMDLKVLSTTPP